MNDEKKTNAVEAQSFLKVHLNTNIFQFTKKAL